MNILGTKNVSIKILNLMILCALGIASRPHAANLAPSSKAKLKPCSSVIVDKATIITMGKSTVIQLKSPIKRMLIGGLPRTRSARATDHGKKDSDTDTPSTLAATDGVADVDITLLSPTELFVLGKAPGAMNIVLQNADDQCRIRDLIVTVDHQALQGKLAELMPEETAIQIKAAENSLVLVGSVSDAVKLDQVMSLASAYARGKRLVNLLRINTPQQVMLEVKIAEVSKNMLDKFGLDFSRLSSAADGSGSRFISGIIGGAAGQLNSTSVTLAAGATAAGPVNNGISRSVTQLGIDAQNRDGLIRVLAEPNIMAISGQSASFLSGGKIFIPVPQSASTSAQGFTLEEKEFGVGLKFTPTVLDGTRINLKLVTEASELSQTGSPFTTVGGAISVLPAISTRRVDTTVQLNDGQSFAIAGLIKNNVTESISRFPGLGDLPIVGALFRSTEFQNDKTELIFVITPRLVKPLTGTVTLPTDNHVVPTAADALFKGKAEGAANPERASDGSNKKSNGSRHEK